MSIWSADRTMYYGTRLPDAFDRALLYAHAELHWLGIRTAQNIKHIFRKDRENQ